MNHKPYKESLSLSGSPASDRLYGVRHARSNSHCRRLARRGQPVRRHVTRRRLACGRGWLEGRRRQRATAVASGAHTAVIERFEHIDSHDSDSACARQLVRRQLARPRARRCMRRQRKRPLVPCSSRRTPRMRAMRSCSSDSHARRHTTPMRNLMLEPCTSRCARAVTRADARAERARRDDDERAAAVHADERAAAARAADEARVDDANVELGALAWRPRPCRASRRCRPRTGGARAQWSAFSRCNDRCRCYRRRRCGHWHCCSSLLPPPIARPQARSKRTDTSSKPCARCEQSMPPSQPRTKNKGALLSALLERARPSAT